MRNKQTCDVHYCRSFTSLLVSLGFIFKYKVKKINILIISSQAFKNNHFNKKIFLKIKPFLKQYFNKIIIINYERNFKNGNLFFIHSQRSKSIKKNLDKIKINFKKINVENVFSGGDDFESVLINKLGYFPNFYFTEHGSGNLANAIFNEVTFDSVKKYFINFFLTSFIQKFFFLIRLSYFYPIRFKAYIGILQKNVPGRILINDIFFLDRKIVDLYEVIKQLSDFLKRKKIFKFNTKKKYILFNYSSICLSDNSDYNVKLFKKIRLIIKKDHIVIFKGHPSYKSLKTEKFIKNLMIYLKKNKIKILVIKKNSLLHNLPSQILVKLMNIKIVISDMSTTIFHISNVYKNINCFLPLNFSLNNCSESIAQRLYNKQREFYKKIGKRIKFID